MADSTSASTGAERLAADPPDAAAGEGSVGEAVWRHADHTAYVESPDRVVVLDLDHVDLAPYVFEGTAAVVWSCLDGDRSESEIVSDLAAAYEVETEVVAGDVRQFVDRLRDLGLVVAGA